MVKLVVTFATYLLITNTAFSAWPDKPIKIIVPYPAGGGVDAVARTYAERLSELLNTNEMRETDIDLTIEAKTFCDLIHQLLIFDEILTLTFSEDKIDMKSSGNEGSMQVEMKIDDIKEYAIAEGTTIVQSYSLKYIHLMCQFNKLAPEMNMGFSKDKPMTMKYDLLEESYVRIHLAPKMVDDEN